MPSALIIADLHLAANEVNKTRLFVQFCQTQAMGADRLFILGDLFNAWLGDDLSITHYSTIISALKKLSAHTQIFVITGNRDFLLGNVFEKHSGARLLQTPHVLETQQYNYVLIHGDELCTDDTAYQRLKCVLQQPIIRFLTLKLPKKLRLALAAALQQKAPQQNNKNQLRLWM